MDTVRNEEDREDGAVTARQNLDRLQRIVERTLVLLQEMLEEPGQFRTAQKQPGENGGDERVFRLDTRALKEFISALKELRGLVDQEDPDLPREEGLRVIFEAGEEAFNE